MFKKLDSLIFNFELFELPFLFLNQILQAGHLPDGSVLGGLRNCTLFIVVSGKNTIRLLVLVRAVHAGHFRNCIFIRSIPLHDL